MEPRISKRNADYSSGRRKNKTVKSVDRIRALPDSILGAVLSLLPTKNAVATSTLSKRWEYVWKTIHNLDFCLEVHGGSRDEQVKDENKKFIGFVNHVLLHHDVGVLKRFHLVWTHDCIHSHAISWIKTAITRNVHELSITLESHDYGQIDMLPISVFSCDSLRSLKLGRYICLSASLLSLKLSRYICLAAANVFCFPRLESLHLYGVAFQSDEAFEKIIRACPVLNYLIIHMNDDDEEDDFRFIITSTSLRRLELDFGFCRKYLMLEAPSLEHLKICGHTSGISVQKNLSSLVEANFEIGFDYGDDFYQASNCNSIVDAVGAFDRAKILTLSYDVMRALSCATFNLSTDFKRLVKLETSVKCCHWGSLRDIIQRSNKLEVLTISQCLMDVDDENDHYHSNWTTPVEVPICLSTSLKNVVFNDYNGYEDEKEMLHYMLKHGSVLEIMQISCHRNENHRKFELLQEICEFPRKSPACKVKFLE